MPIGVNFKIGGFNRSYTDKTRLRGFQNCCFPLVRAGGLSLYSLRKAFGIASLRA